jgi:hypothetical protein
LPGGEVELRGAVVGDVDLDVGAFQLGGVSADPVGCLVPERGSYVRDDQCTRLVIDRTVAGELRCSAVPGGSMSC